MHAHSDAQLRSGRAVQDCAAASSLVSPLPPPLNPWPSLSKAFSIAFCVSFQILPENKSSLPECISPGYLSAKVTKYYTGVKNDWPL